MDADKSVDVGRARCVVHAQIPTTADSDIATKYFKDSYLSLEISTPAVITAPSPRGS